MSAPQLRLFHYWRSSASWRVRWALALKKIPFEPVAVNLLNDETQRPEHLARNPMGFVPVLEILDPALAPAGTMLAESLPILEWLEEVFPGATRLLPSTPFARHRARQFFELVNAGIQPIQNMTVLEYLEYNHGADEPARKAWMRHWMSQGFQAIETILAQDLNEGRRKSGFCVGEALTYAELALLPQVYNARRQELDLEPFPEILAITKRCESLPEYKASHPDSFQPKP